MSYYTKNKKHILKICKVYQNRTHNSNKYYHNNKKRLLLSQKIRVVTEKILVLQIYSNGTMKCNICGYNKNIDALSLDHINNDGNLHRKKIKKYGNTFYTWLISNNFPNGYNVLCMNCQIIKSINSRG